MPLALIVATVATISARVTARLGTKRTVALGISIATVGLLFTAFTFRTDTPVIMAIIAQVILGIGMGSTFSPATNSIMSAVPIDKAGVGSAMNDTTRQLGGALGVAVLGAVMNITYLGNVGTLKSALPQLTKPTLDLIGSSVQAAHEVAATLPDQAQHIVLMTANQAFVDGMRSALIVAAVIMAVMAVFVLLTLPAQVQRAEERQPAMAEFAARSDAESVPAGR
jgi:MFS family permease